MLVVQFRQQFNQNGCGISDRAAENPGVKVRCGSGQPLLRKEAKERATAEAQSQQMGSLELEFKRKAGEQGALYGSVTSMDIAETLRERGYEIDRHRIHLREPLKRVGDYTVPVRLHREVTIDLKVKVVPEGEVIVGHLTPEQEAALAAPEASE